MYKKLVVHSIRAPRSLDILTDAIYRGLGDSMKISWRPDWSRAVPPYIASRQGHTLRYSTSTSKLADTQYHTVDAFLLDDQVLSVRDYQVDTVAWKSTLMPFLEEDDASTELRGMVFRIWQLQMAVQVDIRPVDTISFKGTF